MLSFYLVVGERKVVSREDKESSGTATGFILVPGGDVIRPQQIKAPVYVKAEWRS